MGRLLDGKSPSPADDFRGLLGRPDGGTDTPLGQIRPVSGTVGLVGAGASALRSAWPIPRPIALFSTAIEPLLSFFVGPKTESFRFSEISYFGKQIQKQFPNDWYWFTGFYVVMVALGLSFVPAERSPVCLEPVPALCRDLLCSGRSSWATARNLRSSSPR